MSMTKEEQAVIDAAIAWVDGDESNASTIELDNAVNMLLVARAAAPPTIDQLCDVIRVQRQSMTSGDCRALLMVQRLTHYKQWPATNAREMAELDTDIIRDVRNAGPYVWKVWADALRALDIEPTWAKELGV
jgi:hypothetical protein